MKFINSAKWLVLVMLWILILFFGCHKKPRFMDPDVTPPAVSDIFVENVTNKSATISWNVNENCTAILDYGTSAGYGAILENAFFGTSGSIRLVNLTESTVYHYRLTLSDSSGNRYSTADSTFTTSGPLASIVITPASDTIFIEESVMLSAVGKDAAGRSVEISPSWSLSDATYGSLDQTIGLSVTFIAGLNKGTVTLNATANAISGAVIITITGGAYPEPPQGGEIFMATSATASELVAEYDIGLNTLAGKTDWLNENKTDWAATHDYLKMAYPGDTCWGAVFIVVAPMKPYSQYTERNAFDYRTYSKIQLEIKGANGNEKVKIGIKDINDPDDGGEIKYFVSNITKDWQTFEIPLNTFPSGDRAQLKQIFVPLEFVWDSDPINVMDPLIPVTIYVRNIKYVK